MEGINDVVRAFAMRGLHEEVSGGTATEGSRSWRSLGGGAGLGRPPRRSRSRLSTRGQGASRASRGPSQRELDLDAIAVRPALALEEHLIGHRNPDLLASGPQL
jgi:hypothetical protein